MKVSIERSALLKAMSQAQSVVERRNTIPILANVLIEAEGSEISFRATDLDIEVVYKVVGMVERAGATTVSAHMLHEIVRKLPDGAMVELAEVEVERFLIRKKWLLINADKRTDKEVYSSYSSSSFFGSLRCSFRFCILMIWMMIWTMTRR